MYLFIDTCRINLRNKNVIANFLKIFYNIGVLQIIKAIEIDFYMINLNRTIINWMINHFK